MRDDINIRLLGQPDGQSNNEEFVCRHFEKYHEFMLDKVGEFVELKLTDCFERLEKLEKANAEKEPKVEWWRPILIGLAQKVLDSLNKGR